MPPGGTCGAFHDESCLDRQLFALSGLAKTAGRGNQAKSSQCGFGPPAPKHPKPSHGQQSTSQTLGRLGSLAPSWRCLAWQLGSDTSPWWRGCTGRCSKHFSSGRVCCFYTSTITYNYYVDFSFQWFLRFDFSVNQWIYSFEIFLAPGFFQRSRPTGWCLDDFGWWDDSASPCVFRSQTAGGERTDLDYQKEKNMQNLEREYLVECLHIC